MGGTEASSRPIKAKRKWSLLFTLFLNPPFLYCIVIFSLFQHPLFSLIFATGCWGWGVLILLHLDWSLAHDFWNKTALAWGLSCLIQELKRLLRWLHRGIVAKKTNNDVKGPKGCRQNGLMKNLIKDNLPVMQGGQTLTQKQWSLPETCSLKASEVHGP